MGIEQDTEKAGLTAVLMIIALLFLLIPGSVSASVTIADMEGWKINCDGRVSSYATWVDGDNEAGTFRLRAGFNPSKLGFDVYAPETKDKHKIMARIGLYPSVQNDRQKNARTDFDVREVFFTLTTEGGSEWKLGRSLSLFQRGQVIMDMSGLSVGGGSGTAAGNAATGGRLGYGYLYTNFNNSVQYTTPSLSGLKLSAGLYDPSVIGDSGVGTVVATVTKLPRIESEVTWDLTNEKKNGLNLFLSGLWQEAEFDGGVTTPAGKSKGDSVTAMGVGFGGTFKYDMITLGAAGYTGDALGDGVLLDTTGVLKANGDEEDADGWYTQITCQLERISFGIAYGITNAGDTEKSGPAFLTVYDFDKWIKFNFEVATYTDDNGVTEIDSTVVDVGAVFNW